MTAVDARAAVEAVWRGESARIVASVARLVRDVGTAEEIAQDALVAALQEWPQTGVPPNPGGWLMVAAKHRAIDRLRRNDRLAERIGHLGYEAAARQADHGVADIEAVAERDDLHDDLLRLIFVACHPVLPTEARVALTLRVVGGLSTEELARAFLAQESAVQQRIVRAKRLLAERQIPFEVPPPAQRPARLASVLEVVYLIFNEGYAATAGEDWVRPALCAEGLRLGRLLAELCPDEAEVLGLVALMELQSSRLAARVDAAGVPVPLPRQDRGRWDRAAIERGFAVLLRAERLRQPVGRYVLQAAIAAVHARATSAEDTEWARIAALYNNLLRLIPTPVVELNRAVALSRAEGPAAALAVVDRLAADPALRGYHLLPAVRGDLLAQLGRGPEARAEFERAAGLTRNAREREALLGRAREGFIDD